MNTIFEEYFKNLNFLNEKINDDMSNLLLEQKNQLDCNEKEITHLKLQNHDLNEKCLNLNEECKNYQKVSIVKNLNSQLNEKNNLIKILNNKIDSLNKKLNVKKEEERNHLKEEETNNLKEEERNHLKEEERNHLKEEETNHLEVEVEEVEEVEVEVEEVEEVEVEEEEEEEENEEIEIDFIEKRLKPPNGHGRKIFLITDDEDRDIYEKLDSGEPGNHVGRLVGKQNKPFFFK